MLISICKIFAFRLSGAVTVPSGQSSMAPKGSTIVLKCTYEWMEDCTWTRGGFVIDINRSNRYHFLTTNIHHSQDCSLRIDNFQELDAAEWGCHIYTGYNSNEPVQVKYSWLDIYGNHLTCNC